MKVLITGGAGLIGSHLADRLVERGDEVSIIDNFSTGSRDNVPEGSYCLWDDCVSSLNCDLYFDEIKPDVVVHAAASYRDPDDWNEDSRTNVLGTVNMVKQSLEYGVKRFIYLQTSLCYGPPQQEPITLDHPINPGCSYAISKVAAERYIMMSGLDWVSFRLANFYGPRQVSGPIPAFYNKLRNGEQCTIVKARRDYVYVDDLIDILVKAMDGGPGGLYQVSSGTDRPIIDVYNLIKASFMIPGKAALLSDKIFPQPIIKPLGEDDVGRILLDNSKVVEDYGFEATVSLEEGIKRTIKWYEENGVDGAFTHLRGMK